MHQSQIKTLIWDLGGVLIDWNPDYVFRQIYPDPAERKWFFDNICTPEWNLEQDRGRPLKEATEEKIAEWPDYEMPIRAFYGRWEEMLGGPIRESVDILGNLKSNSRVRLLALTNWSHETFPIALERYDFLHWFEGIVVSGREGMIKPEQEIYELILNRFDVDPLEALFIDDNPSNVEASEKLGMQGVLFTSAGQLKVRLDELGVK